MSFALLQKKFSGGEISPLLWGDTSVPRYGSSLRTCLNWLPISHGALVRRPGTKYITTTPSNVAVRTKGFIFPDGRSYILEFSNLSMRVIRAGALVGGGSLPLTTPWTTAMLPFLKFAQAGNVITITYGGQAAGDGGVSPRDLTRTPGSDTAWFLSATPFTPPTVTWTLAPHVQFAGGADFAAWSNATTYAIGDRVRQANQSYISIQNSNLNHDPTTAGSLFWTLANDITHPTYQITWAVTAVVQDHGSGVVFETTVQATGQLKETLAPDRPIQLFFGLPSAALYDVLYLRVYRGFNGTTGVLGWIANVLPTGGNISWIDQGQAPDYTQQPPSGADPFLVNAVDNYPAAVSHYEQRRYFFRSSVLPQSIWGSAIGVLTRFDRPVPGSDSDSVFFTIASEILEEIRSFASMRVGLILTGMGEYAMLGSQSASVTRSNVSIKRQSQWGSSWLDPLVVGTGIIFNTAKNNMVRDLFPLYGLYTDIWDGDDLSWQARHLMEGHTIVDWAYQSTPYSIVWMVRDDGVLLSMTYVRPARGSISDNAVPVVAWAQHTNLGFVENVAVVQEAPEDGVYIVVRRVVNGVTQRWHERLVSPIPPTDTRKAVFLDGAVVYDGRATGGVTVQLSGGTYHVGTQATATASAPMFASTDVGKSAIVFDPDGSDFVGPLTARIVAFTSTTVVTVEFDAELTSQQIGHWASVPTAVWALAKSVFSGAPWRGAISGYTLDSGSVGGTRGIAALVVGNVVDGYQILMALIGGQLTLPDPGVDVVIGLNYNSDVQLLDAYHPSAELRNKFKSLIRIGFHVASSRGLWVGKDFTTLYEWDQRAVTDSYGVIQPGTGYFENEVSDDWNKDGSAALRQWEPLPCTLLGVLREMELGGT